MNPLNLATEIFDLLDRAGCKTAQESRRVLALCQQLLVIAEEAHEMDGTIQVKHTLETAKARFRRLQKGGK